MAKAKTANKVVKGAAKAKAKAKAKVKAVKAVKAAKPRKAEAKAKAKPRSPTKPRPRAATEPASWHTWPTRPDDLAVLDHVEAFFQAVHGNDFTRAFTLCPIYTYEEPLVVGHGDRNAVQGAVDNMKETLGGYDYIAVDDAAWHARVTPPSRVSYQQLNLAVPEDQGDTLANVFVDDKVTDVTSVFALLERDDRWLLAFKMFKVM